MARLVKMRVNYIRDNQYFANLAASIVIDKRQSPEWTKKALEAIATLQNLFVTAHLDETE